MSKISHLTIRGNDHEAICVYTNVLSSLTEDIILNKSVKLYIVNVTKLSFLI